MTPQRFFRHSVQKDGPAIPHQIMPETSPKDAADSPVQILTVICEAAVR